MSDAPERIGLIGDGLGRWALATRDESDIAVHYIRTTATPEVFAALEPVQALVAGAYEAGALTSASLWRWDDDGWLISRPKSCEILAAIRALTPTDALAALAAREAAAERRGWLAGMERAAGIVARRAQDYHDEHGIYDSSTGVTEYPGTGSESMEEWEEIAAAIRAEMGK